MCRAPRLLPRRLLMRTQRLGGVPARAHGAGEGPRGRGDEARRDDGAAGRVASRRLFQLYKYLIVKRVAVVVGGGAWSPSAREECVIILSQSAG